MGEHLEKPFLNSLSQQRTTFFACVPQISPTLWYPSTAQFYTLLSALFWICPVPHRDCPCHFPSFPHFQRCAPRISGKVRVPHSQRCTGAQSWELGDYRSVCLCKQGTPTVPQDQWPGQQATCFAQWSKSAVLGHTLAQLIFFIWQFLRDSAVSMC